MENGHEEALCPACRRVARDVHRHRRGPDASSDKRRWRAEQHQPAGWRRTRRVRGTARGSGKRWCGEHRAARFHPELTLAGFANAQREEARLLPLLLAAAEGQSSVSTRTSLRSWLLPTQNVTGVVELSTNTVRMLVSPGIRYCTAVPVFGSTRTTRSVYIVDAHNSPFLSKLARYG